MSIEVNTEVQIRAELFNASSVLQCAVLTCDEEIIEIDSSVVQRP